MPNQLVIPFKKTFVIPVHKAVREYFQENLSDIHPDAFKWDINKWEMLRKRTLDDTVHIDRINDFLK
jgi:programmed cell death 6-interacting protein